MKIIQLDGLDPQLFALVGPLVMNPKVLKANNNYPFKTGAHFRWYIAIEDEQVIGFLPMENKSRKFIINNYYVQDDNPNILRRLLNAADTPSDLYSITQTKHEATFAECGFRVEHRWTKYIKMIYEPKK